MFNDKFYQRLDAIISRHEQITETGCWIWMGATTFDGYGQASIKGRQRLVHRLVYAVKTGAMPARNHVVMHSCDVPSCINPAHLHAGSQRQNLEDMARKNRAHWQKA